MKTVKFKSLNINRIYGFYRIIYWLKGILSIFKQKIYFMFLIVS